MNCPNCQSEMLKTNDPSIPFLCGVCFAGGRMPKTAPRKRSSSVRHIDDYGLPDPKSEAECKLYDIWPMISPDPIRKPYWGYAFWPGRRHKFDLAFPCALLGVEIEGGIWTGGRHTRGSGWIGDQEKYNMAAEIGWTILRYTPDDIEKRPQFIVDQVWRTYQNRMRQIHNC